MNALFKKIYEGGTEEQRRAMNKSFQKSGGTVLSTIWDKVRKYKVESLNRPMDANSESGIKSTFFLFFLIILLLLHKCSTIQLLNESSPVEHFVNNKKRLLKKYMILMHLRDR